MFQARNNFVVIVCTTGNSVESIQSYFLDILCLSPAAGFDPSSNQVHSKGCPSPNEEWLLLVDQTDQSHQRAVIIKHKHSGRFLAVQNGSFIGLTSYNEGCKWFLE